MKDKIKGFFNKAIKKEEQSIEEIPVEEQLKTLKKENAMYKKSLQTQAIEKFKTRRSIRKFSEQDVDFEIIFNIIDAGLSAPQAGNIQNSKIIVIKNKQKKEECAKICLQQYWMADAPYILAIVRQNHDLTSLYPDKGELYSIQNTAAVIENILMASHFYGLGACWIESADNNVLCETLGVPNNCNIDALIPIGYPLENPKIDKVACENLMYYEKYGEKTR